MHTQFLNDHILLSPQNLAYSPEYESMAGKKYAQHIAMHGNTNFPFQFPTINPQGLGLYILSIMTATNRLNVYKYRRSCWSR